MNSKQQWVCLACEQRNAPADKACSRCGCPSSASGYEVERYKAAFTQTPPRPSFMHRHKYRLTGMAALLVISFALHNAATGVIQRNRPVTGLTLPSSLLPAQNTGSST